MLFHDSLELLVATNKAHNREKAKLFFLKNLSKKTEENIAKLNFELIISEDKNLREIKSYVFFMFPMSSDSCVAYKVKIFTASSLSLAK